MDDRMHEHAKYDKTNLEFHLFVILWESFME